MIREEREEMVFTERLCPGAGAWEVKIAHVDARESITLVGPGEDHPLQVSRIGGGGFSNFGKTAEWRGQDVSREVGGHFEPDSLIVRYDVAEQPYPAPDTSYLLVVKLGRAPCIVAKIAPGPGQNESARAAADDPGACIAT